jgi:hypothetical protein
VREELNLICLCRTCRNEFMDTKGFYIRRANHKQNVKDVCTYCQTRRGYDYYVSGCHIDEGRGTNGISGH